MSLRDSISTIMERFDFEQVHHVMKFLNWRWAGVGIPEVFQLEAQAIQLLEWAVKEYEEQGYPLSGMNVSTGGFVAEVVTFAKVQPRLQLTFYVDQVSTI